MINILIVISLILAGAVWAIGMFIERAALSKSSNGENGKGQKGKNEIKLIDQAKRTLDRRKKTYPDLGAVVKKDKMKGKGHMKRKRP
jgi:hypothetical protein